MTTCGKCVMGVSNGLEVVCRKNSYAEKNAHGEEVLRIQYHSPHDGCEYGTQITDDVEYMDWYFEHDDGSAAEQRVKKAWENIRREVLGVL